MRFERRQLRFHHAFGGDGFLLLADTADDEDVLEIRLQRTRQINRAAKVWFGNDACGVRGPMEGRSGLKEHDRRLAHQIGLIVDEKLQHRRRHRHDQIKVMAFVLEK